MLCDTPTRTNPSLEAKKKIALLFPITLMLLSLTLIIVITIKLIPSRCKPSKEVPQPPMHWKIGAPPDTGDCDLINLAPQKARSSEEQENYVFTAPASNPSRDPIAQFLSKSHPDMLAMTQGKETKKDTIEDHDADPMMYFGPTLDEDGYPLHNIDII